MARQSRVRRGSSNPRTEDVRFGYEEVIEPSDPDVPPKRLSVHNAQKEGQYKRYRKTGVFDSDDATGKRLSLPSPKQFASVPEGKLPRGSYIEAMPTGDGDAVAGERKRGSRDVRRRSGQCRIRNEPVEARTASPPPAPKPEMITTSTDNPKIREPGFFARVVSRLKKKRREKQLRKKIEKVTKHKLDKNVLLELENQVATQVPSNAQLAKFISEGVGPDEDDDKSEDSEGFEESDVRVRDFVNLLGVDPHVPHRTPFELYTDRERLNAEKNLAISSKTTNAAILQDLDLEKFEDYDEEFLVVWDLDAGQDLIEYMDEQIDAYQCENDQLCEENRSLKVELFQLKRKKQDAYFRVKDLETVSFEAEKRYGRLHKTRPSKRQLDKLNNSRKKMIIVAALLDQREELFHEHRRIHRELSMGSNTYRKEEHEANKELTKAARALQDAVKLYHKALRDEEIKRKDLTLIQQEMNYLSEEIGLYVFQDGNSHHNLKVGEALAYLSKDVKVPEENSNPVKKLSQIERSLTNLKATGFQYMKTVNDTHAEVLWHVNRREDILANLIRDYMERKGILKLDPKILKVMHIQRQNVSLIEIQIAEQNSIAREMEPRWLTIKEENARLRDLIVRLSVVSHSQKKSRQEIMEEEKVLRRQSLEQLCATFYDQDEQYPDEIVENTGCICDTNIVAVDTWGDTSDTDHFCEIDTGS